MPKGNDWIIYIFINFGFFILLCSVLYLTSIKKIRDDWDKYRCSHYFIFSENYSKDFQICTKNIFKDLVPTYITPYTSVLGELASMGLGLSDDIQEVRGMFDYIRTQISDIINVIMGIFINLIIEFTKISLGLKDMMGKLVGVVSILVYIMDGAFKTMSSANSLIISPITCFLPTTKVKLQNGEILFMKDIQPGSILENGSKVLATMNLDNSHGEPLYIIKNGGVNNEDIYVTGSHFILYNKKYILVKDFPKAILQNTISSPNYASLITSDHTIQIGQYTFWDWEDDELYK